MGLSEAKYMLIVLITILAITNIFAIKEPNLSSLKDNGQISKVYNLNTGQLSSDGIDQFTMWQNESSLQQTDTPLDWLFSAYDKIKGGIKLIFGFIYAPYELTKNMVALNNYDFIDWLPGLIGLIWTIAWVITFLMIIKGE